MGKKWSKEQRAKFSATVAAKREASEGQHFPIDMLPDRAPPRAKVVRNHAPVVEFKGEFRINGVTFRTIS